MPENYSGSGSIYSEGANGQAATPAYFNFADCMILDFDGNGSQGFWSWSETGSMINADDLVEDPYDSGRGKCVQIVPERLLKAGVISANRVYPNVGQPAMTMQQMIGAVCILIYTATTPLTEVALQFDVYVPEAWSGTGHLQISLFNNFNFGGIGSDDDGASIRWHSMFPGFRKVLSFHSQPQVGRL